MNIKIIEKDISWLTERVPDFHKFLEGQSYYFNDGYLAGGFLRRIIKNGSVKKTLENMAGDIDFFFYNQSACTNAFSQLKTTLGRFGKGIQAPNSKTGFAYEGDSVPKYEGENFPFTVKFQFIYKSYGKPEEVLNRFDIANAKIATDGKKVWMVEGWEKLENDKIIRVDNLSGNYLAWRLKKYIGKDYSLYPENYQEVLIKLLETANIKPQIDENIKNLVRNKKVISNDADVLLFHDLLGRTWENTEPEDYQNGTLGASVDYALHTYKQRVGEKK